ncbi:hypothetical protein [Mycobacterium tuberculosis]|uniref:hypothetical protein n=1 Tax=Mycobacterium tuberculosis TaxID=1773 RepID=UPI00186AF5F4|nr:hypothetical protein [Mycobacterium tuberculosis]
MLEAIFSDKLSGAALTGIKYILPELIILVVVGIFTHEETFGESDDGLAKTRGIERLTPAIVAIVYGFL